MPNHIHGILILTGNGNINHIDNNDADNANVDNVETGHALSLRQQQQIQPTGQSKTIGQQRFQNIGKNSVSSIIGSYKSAVTKHAHRLGFDFQWQSRFHDHIIRNDNAYQHIANYINTNPENWEQDKFFKSEEL